MTVGPTFTDWASRPPEVAYLLNSAFCATLLRNGVKSFEGERDAGMPLHLCFLLMPIVLHKPTRSLLPSTTATRMLPWLEEHQSVRVGFAARVRNIAPYTREALVFALRHGHLTVATDATVGAPKIRLRKYSPQEGTDAGACIAASALVGKWFGRSQDLATTFAAWGVRP